MVKLTAVSCPPVVEVKIKRPDTKYQLGFSVQNGVVSREIRPKICSFFENSAVDYFTFTALNSADEFSNEQQISGLREFHRFRPFLWPDLSELIKNLVTKSGHFCE